MRHRRRLLLPVLALVAAAAGCSGGDGDSPASPTPVATTGPTLAPGTNLLANAGFEEGPEPWVSLAPESGFEITQEQANGGSSSAVLRMHDPLEAAGDGPTHTKVYYLVQEVSPAEMPEIVRGYYYVDDWVPGAPFQYLQFVVIAFDPDNFPADTSNYQIRYPIAGINSPPFAIGNAKFVFVTREDPVVGQWTAFEVHPKADFEEYWGKVPQGFSKLRLLFEVRWDQKVAGEGAPSGDVYYDDLYVGN